MRLKPVALFLFVLTLPLVASAQEWGAVSGTIRASDTSYPVPGATVIVHGTNFGTAADEEGRYTLRLPMGNFVLRISSVGFTARLDSVRIHPGKTHYLNISLEPSTVEIGEITVEGRAAVQAGVFQINPEDVQSIPAPLRDALRALKVLPGVVTNSELSNQFSVRGGGFNENLFFINGFEIFLPFRPRTGEQEGLSLINADMATSLSLYTGGFSVRYGGKLSSAVDAQYRRPQRNNDSLRVTGYASLLDLGLTASSSAASGRLGWVLGARKAQARRFFQTQDLQGEYKPKYLDIQGYLGIEIAPGHEAELLAMYAENEFRLDPNSRKTFFGTLSQNSALAPSNLQSLWIRFDASNEERDGYQTGFFGFRLLDRFSPRFRTEHDISFYSTRETEKFELSGTAILFQVDPTSDSPDSGNGLFPTGSSRQEDAADNRIDVQTLTAQGRLYRTGSRHASEAGWSARRLKFDDRLQEKSVVTGRALNGEIVRIVADSLNDATSFDAWQTSFYVQDSFDALSDYPGKLMLTAGFRADYFSFTGEWTYSPRLSFTYQANPVTTYFGSVGLYNQAPTYRELRGKPEVGESILGALNNDLKSQKSVQIVLGGEYFIPSKRFFLRAESYVKRVSRVISYDIENVRVRYSGDNDATALMYGLDLQFRGELVPGMESWVNYSYLRATEKFQSGFITPQNGGTVSRPTDQRHTITMFVQDYIPSDPTWKLHLRTLYGSGLPYTPPIPGEQVGNLLIQAPGQRFSARYTRFFRFDIGATKEIPPSKTGSDLSVELTAEILNLFNMINTVSYSWVPDASGIWQRIPTRLTPRTFNVRLAVRF